jgi:hypothetical protein
MVPYPGTLQPIREPRHINDLDGARRMTTLVSSQKQQQLRQLNAESRDLQAALNQARGSLDHAMRLVEDSYQKKRREIIDADLEDHI